MKTERQMRDDILQGAEQALDMAHALYNKNFPMAQALDKIAAETQKAAKEGAPKEILLVAIGKLAGALSVAHAYLKINQN